MKKFFTLIVCAMLATVGAMATTYTVAGASAIVNGTSSWDPANAANDMTSADGVNYTLTVEGCILEAGTSYQYKVCEDHAWATCYGSEGGPDGNAELKVTETGTYTVVFSFSTATLQPTAAATKTGGAVIGEKTYSIAGSSVELFGGSWDQTSSVTDMTKQADGTYKWEKKNVTLGKQTVQYKIVVNHSWDEAYPSSNARLEIPEDGSYDCVFTFDPASKAVDATATKTGSAVVEKTYTVVGGSAAIFGEEWNPALEANDMTQLSDGIYAITKSGLELEAGDYEWKVAVNHAWDESYPVEGNSTFTLGEAGIYDLTFSFNPLDNSLWVEMARIDTAIRSLQMSDGVQQNIYSLQGQRVSNPQRGIYIRNGRKVVVGK